MNWTRERPTEEGYYWVRGMAHAKRPMIVLVSGSKFDRAAGMTDVCFAGNASVCALNSTNFDQAQWAGPLLPPE